jgi:hypothetical protein
LLDSEIAAKLAEAMGWVKVYCDWFIDGVPNSENPPSFTGYSWNKGNHQGRARGPLFDPVFRADHMWICLEWAQKEFGPFRTTIIQNPLLHTIEILRASWFQAMSEDSASYQEDLDLTPRHIALAILKAVEG